MLLNLALVDHVIREAANQPVSCRTEVTYERPAARRELPRWLPGGFRRQQPRRTTVVLRGRPCEA